MRPMPRLRHGLAAAFCVLATAILQMQSVVVAAPAAYRWKDPVDLPVEVLPLVARSLLLGLVETEQGTVAVGERGAVLVSSDRATWTQIANVPTRATLTAVTAAGAKLWAVGHDGVILASADGGRHWILQRKDPWHEAPEDEVGESDPRQGAPLLGVLALDEKHVIAVGAYSQLLMTQDGGENWTTRSVADHSAANAAAAAAAAKQNWTFSEQELEIGDESDPHLNAITRTGDGSLFVAGERGVAFRSNDQGQTWQRVKWPYDGSMFGVIGFEGRHVLAFGLRGHAYESADLGEHWREIDTGTELSLLGGARLSDGGAVLVGANGLVLLRRSSGDAFHAGTASPAGALVAALPADGSTSFILAGENGISRFRPTP